MPTGKSDFDVDEKFHVQQDLATSLEKVEPTTQHRRKNMLDFRKYTQQIWLAGLGAFSRAEEEGSKLFDSLVKMGEELEAKSSGIADQTVEKAKESVESVLDTKEKLERRLDQRLQQSLNKVGLATYKDIQHLEEMLLQLHDKVDRLLEEKQKTSE